MHLASHCLCAGDTQRVTYIDLLSRPRSKLSKRTSIGDSNPQNIIYSCLTSTQPPSALQRKETCWPQQSPCKIQLSCPWHLRLHRERHAEKTSRDDQSIPSRWWRQFWGLSNQHSSQARSREVDWSGLQKESGGWEVLVPQTFMYTNMPQMLVHKQISMGRRLGLTCVRNAMGLTRVRNAGSKFGRSDMNGIAMLTQGIVHYSHAHAEQKQANCVMRI